MPIYEYECTKCGQLREAWQKFSEPPLTECDRCHGKLRKVISHSSFHLKGTGWYVTDYASKSAGNQGEKTHPEKNSSAASTESKETSKPDSPKAKESADTKKKGVSSTQ